MTTNSYISLGAGLFFLLVPGFVNSATYEVSGTFNTVGAYQSAGGPNIVTNGSITVGGFIETDTDAPGYSIVGGNVTLQGEVTVVLPSLPDVIVTLNLTDGIPNDAGVLFNSGETCVDSFFGVLCSNVDQSSTIDFSSFISYLGQPVQGLQLTGGAGGDSFTVTQPGGVTPILGSSPSDWSKSVGAIRLRGINALLFFDGTINLTLTDDRLNRRPNIVVIQVDDLESNMLGQIPTPNITEHLYREGVRFLNSFVTNPDATSSLATLLTGQYAHNHKVYSSVSANPLVGGIGWDGWLGTSASPGRESNTLPNWLREAGYRTGFIGKYLDGYGLVAPEGVADPETYVPPGWDDWQGFIRQSANLMYNYTMNENGTIVSYGESESDYQTDVLADKTADFILGSDDEQPFFVLVRPGAPRVEFLDPLGFLSGNDPLAHLALKIRPAPRHAHLLDNDEANGEIGGLPNWSGFSYDVAGRPSCPRPSPPSGVAIVSRPVCVADSPVLTQANIDVLEQRYKSSAVAMLAVDDLVGGVVDALTSIGQLDNTVIVFTSSSGDMQGNLSQVGQKLAYNTATRTSLYIRAPAGRRFLLSLDPIINNDLAPTLASFAGAQPPYTPDGFDRKLLLAPRAPGEIIRDRENFLIEHWFVPSLFKYASPTFTAWRGHPADESPFIYISTRANPDDPDEVTAREFYTFFGNHFNQDLTVLPEDLGQLFDLLLNVFQGCAGTVCHDHEMR